ncbi:thialysine N-epsilon-acetyltransferase isoform X2 [Teleopsis dalmanni]|uniref:thialysine N-epsilon-acetyltransferase isoform X2 n=1 Tax=Teleopsis dalmanni TaxID=139649 RepID=UPI0018CF8C45|nr:thialysine N-epsilon-acetyltransferase isoform X2 [Teleopsis dalmanni]
MEEHKFIFRRAEIDDMKPVREMIQDLLEFENNAPTVTEEGLIKESGLAGGDERCHIYILEIEKPEGSEPIAIGYAICYFSYSTWQGRTYFLEYLYVRPEYRGINAGTFLFRNVAAKAKFYNCKRLDFHVKSTFPSRKCFEKNGAINLTEAEEWLCYTVPQNQLQILTETL